MTNDGRQPNVERAPRAQQGESAPQETRGRKKGDGTINDDPALHRMRELITAREAKSVRDAARQVEPEAFGTGTESSTITRLAKKYPLRYPRGSRVI